MAHTPTSDTARAATLTIAIVGHWSRHRWARVCCVMPADTSPTTRPDASCTGAIARIDGPSVPVYTSVNVSPRSAGSMVPR